MSFPEDEFAVHMELVTSEGFALNPEAFVTLGGWNHILLQIHMATHYIGRLQAHSPKLGESSDAFEQNAFFVAFLTSYGKCFVSASSRSIKLDPNDVFKTHPTVRPVHGRIIGLRHTYAAHNANSDLVQTTMAVREEPDQFVLRHLITTAMPANEFGAFSMATGVVSNYVTFRLNQRLGKLETKLGKQIVLD